MTNPWGLFLLVGTGGFAGSAARYGLNLAAQRAPFDWPLGTLAANVLGCLCLGLLTEFSARSTALSPEVRLALGTGFCGGFTTMSSMIYETAAWLRAGEYLHAAVYSAGTFLLSMAAFFTGIALVRVLFRTGGGSWN